MFTTKTMTNNKKKDRRIRSLKNKDYKKYIMTKASNHNPIRVIYKKVGQPPEVKIINSIFKLKKFIIERNLDIIPYESLYIICKSRKQIPDADINIVLDFSYILGDLILVGIDKITREFQGLSQEDVLWYTKDLQSKSYLANPSPSFSKVPTKASVNNKSFAKFHERDLDWNTSTNISMSEFEISLIHLLSTIESLLKKDKNSLP